MRLKELFPEWYSLVDPGFSSERINSRLAAISKIKDWITLGQLVSLVALFYEDNSNTEFVAQVRTAIKEADDTYVSHDRAELAIVAAAVLYLLLDQPGEIANVSALLLLSGDYGGLQGAKRVDAVVKKAAQYLSDEGTRARDTALRFPDINEILTPAADNLRTLIKASADEEAISDEQRLEWNKDTLDALMRLEDTGRNCLLFLSFRKDDDLKSRGFYSGCSVGERLAC